MKPNIFLIIPNLDFGGAQLSFSNLSRSLGDNYNVTNIVFNKDEIADYGFSGDLISLEIPATNNIIFKVFHFFNRVIKLRKLKRRLSVELSISFLEGADYINILSKRKEKIILSVRGSKYYDQNIKGVLGFIRHRILIPYLYNKSNAIVALNEGIKNELNKLYGIYKPIIVIHNWIDIQTIEQKCEKPTNPIFDKLFDDEIIVGHGRLAEEKGYHLFLHSFSLLLKENSKSKFMLIGDGPLREDLQKECVRLGLNYWDISHSGEIDTEKNVFFLGYQPNPFAYLSRATLYIFPSLHEGFGNALIEAMACGLPVIASDCPYGPAEILMKQDEGIAEYGCLIGIKGSGIFNFKKWSDTMSNLLNKPLKLNELRKKSLQRAAEFRQDKMMKIWIDLIESLL